MSDSPLSDIQIGDVTAHWSKSNNLKTNYYKSTDSTNLQAKKNAFSQEELENEFVLYVTDGQTQGKGRFDRTWTSPLVGTSLLSTWSFIVEKTPSPYVTAKVGMALYNALKNTWQNLPLSLKAPNDIYLKDKKVAGVLVETVTQGADHRLLIGVGLNILSHPKELSTATHLLAHLPKHVPLLGEDWILFLDRFFFELTAVTAQAHEEPSSTQQNNLIELLNKNPLLEKPYTNFKDVLKNL